MRATRQVECCLGVEKDRLRCPPELCPFDSDVCEGVYKDFDWKKSSNPSIREFLRKEKGKPAHRKLGEILCEDPKTTDEIIGCRNDFGDIYMNLTNFCTDEKPDRRDYCSCFLPSNKRRELRYNIEKLFESAVADRAESGSGLRKVLLTDNLACFSPACHSSRHKKRACEDHDRLPNSCMDILNADGTDAKWKPDDNVKKDDCLRDLAERHIKREDSKRDESNSSKYLESGLKIVSFMLDLAQKKGTVRDRGTETETVTQDVKNEAKEEAGTVVASDDVSSGRKAFDKAEKRDVKGTDKETKTRDDTSLKKDDGEGLLDTFKRHGLALAVASSLLVLLILLVVR
jgi:hypothetical protein